MKKTKIFCFSDNHERTDFNVPKPDEIDILIHLGDASNDIKESLKWFSTFPHKTKLFVPGNHELYTKLLIDKFKLTEDENEISWGSERKLAQDLNIIFLNNDSYIYNNIMFHGSTLYTDYNLNNTQNYSMLVANQFMQDHNLNYKFKAINALKIHKTSKKILNSFLKNYNNYKQIVLTHHAPFKECVVPEFADDPLNAAFVSNLKLDNYPSHWFFGHTHFNVDYYDPDKNMRVVNNCVGHKNENSKYNSNLIIEV